MLESTYLNEIDSKPLIHCVLYFLLANVVLDKIMKKYKLHY